MLYDQLTIPAFFAAAVAQRADEVALGEIRGGTLRWRTWNEISHDIETLAGELRLAGVARGDRVAQISENRYEWILVDLALHTIGAVHVPIHVTLSGEQIADEIAAAGARVLFVSTAELFAKFAPLLAPGMTIFVHDEQDYTLEKPLLGKPAVAPEATVPGPQPDDLATILFTSGTTGRPRGVMLSQRNLAWTAAATAEVHGGGSQQVRLNILPLSHIYARTCDLYTWLYGGSRLVLAESRETLARDCQLAQPTLLNGVPYVFERIADRVRASGATDTAAALAAEFGQQMQQLYCGGAAIAPELEAWYADHGWPLLSGYGLTETSPVISLSTRSDRKPGTVGRPLAGLELRTADDGELLIRGPNVMLGYWQDEAASAQAIRAGWLHTGDLGELDGDGFLAISGRKKELIVLSNGKKVSPGRVESLIATSPLVEQVAVFGEGRAALVALVVPVRRAGRRASRAELAAEILAHLAAAALEEQVREFAILDRPFSLERGELTPKLSLCRDVIARNFAAELAGLAERESRLEG